MGVSPAVQFSKKRKENIGTSEALSIWHHPPIRDPVITVLYIVDFYEIHVFALCLYKLYLVWSVLCSYHCIDALYLYFDTLSFCMINNW